MKKLVAESLNEYTGKILNEALLPVDEFEKFIDEFVALNDREEAMQKLIDLFNANPEMHQETGDIKGHELYKRGLDKFRNQYNESYKGYLNESLKGEIDVFLKNPVDEKKANGLIAQSFAKQLASLPETKNKLLAKPLADKVEILKQCSKKLEDKTIGILKLFNKEGKLVVGGVAVTGGAKQAVKG